MTTRISKLVHGVTGRVSWPVCEHCLHLGYFGLVCFHGPYEVLAGALLLTGTIGLVSAPGRAR